MTEWFAQTASRLADDPLLQGLLAAFCTFILEDPTTIACGLLVAEQRMAFATALFGVWGGIALGDLGLYGIGRALGPRARSAGLVSERGYDRASEWFRRNLVLALIVSRFVPGMRLPTYLGAGALRAPLARFIVVIIGITLVWTFALLHASLWLGREVLPLLGRARWPVAIVAIVLLVLLQRRLARTYTVDDAEPVASRFEFWPPWLFYLPVGAHYAWLSLRHGGWLLPTCANPGIHAGGFIGESKSAILDLIPEASRQSVAPYTVVERPARSGDAVGEATSAMRQAGLRYPVVAKPDVGQRGAGVRPIRDDDQLRDYLERFPAGEKVMLQALAFDSRDAPLSDGEADSPVREAGVFYWRMPGAAHGEVFSITLKRSPSVVGDGRSRLRELIDRDPRASRIRDIYFKRLGARLAEVPARGARVPLVFAGNHCQGAIFQDGNHLRDALYPRFDLLARQIPGFYFGRFDVRFESLDRFAAGGPFSIIELNGAGGEATHIWDASATLRQAYGTLFRQFSMLFRIGAANRRRGVRPMGTVTFLREIRRYRRLARAYPSTE